MRVLHGAGVLGDHGLDYIEDFEGIAEPVCRA